MPEVTETINAESDDGEKKKTIADMAPLIHRIREFQETRRGESTVYQAPDDLEAFARKTGFAPRGKGKPEVVLAEDVAVELGHPSTSSQSFVLVTLQKELTHNGQITLVGPDFERMSNGECRPFAQVAIAAFAPGTAPDPFDLENLQYLTHRLPGYMVRSVPGRLWARISKQGRSNGLTMETLGSALISAYTEEFEHIEGVEVMFVTSTASDVDELSMVATEAKILAGQHKKLALGIDGEVECSELDCETCEEQPVCDNLRDIVIKRRERKK